jgi:hypothetical protein
MPAFMRLLMKASADSRWASSELSAAARSRSCRTISSASDAAVLLRNYERLLIRYYTLSVCAAADLL